MIDVHFGPELLQRIKASAENTEKDFLIVEEFLWAVYNRRIDAFHEVLNERPSVLLRYSSEIFWYVFIFGDWQMLSDLILSKILDPVRAGTSMSNELNILELILTYDTDKLCMPLAKVSMFPSHDRATRQIPLFGNSVVYLVNYISE